MNENTTPTTPVENAKYNMFVAGLCGVIALWLLGVGLVASIGIMILIGTLLVVATNAKPDNALKHYIRMYAKLIATVALGIVIFLMANAVIGAPAAQLSAWLRHGANLHNIAHPEKWIVLEALIIGIAALMARRAMYAKKIGWLKLTAIILMATTLWTLKATETPWGRWANANIETWTQQWAIKAETVEKAVKPRFAVLSQDAVIYSLKNGILTSKEDGTGWPKGSPVIVKDDVYVSPVSGLRYTKVLLPDDQGEFEKGHEFWFDSRLIEAASPA